MKATVRTMTPTQIPKAKGMTFRTLVPFLAISFGLTWGIAALLIFFPAQLEAIFGALSTTHPLYILAVYGPAFAGVFLVWRYYGINGLGSFFRRLTLWRMSVPWWLFLTLGIPLLSYLAAAMLGTITDPFPFSPWFEALPALGIALLLGPVEELGWRGVALPLLQRRFAPLWSALILGAIWTLWHVPAFLIGGTPMSEWSFIPYFFGILALSVIMTAMFNASRGSILIAALFHFQVMNPLWPDGQPWQNLVFAVAAVLIVIANRKTMLRRKGAVTGVFMPTEDDRLGNARISTNRQTSHS